MGLLKYWQLLFCNCHSVQGQGINFLPLLSPDITMFGSRKADLLQFLSFTEVFTYIPLFLCFFFFLIESQGKAKHFWKPPFCQFWTNHFIFKLSKWVQRYSQREDTVSSTVLDQIVVFGFQPRVGQQCLARMAPWPDAMMITRGGNSIENILPTMIFPSASWLSSRNLSWSQKLGSVV